MPAKTRLRPEDILSLNKAEDLVSIASYRLAAVSNNGVISTPEGLMISKKLVFLSMGEVNPHCDDLFSDDVAKFKTPEEAEQARDKYVELMATIGIADKVVVAAVNPAGTVLAIDGEYMASPEDEMLNEADDWRDDPCEGGQCNMDGVCDKHRGK